MPGWQFVQVVQLVAFEVWLYLPPPHAAHVRFVVALPSVSTSSPGVQDVHAVQAVAEVPSWSHVPVLQGCFSDVPPAQ